MLGHGVMSTMEGPVTILLQAQMDLHSDGHVKHVGTELKSNHQSSKEAMAMVVCLDIHANKKNQVHK